MKAKYAFRLGRHCGWCDAPLKPKVTNAERLECPSEFNRRRFCDRFCWREKQTTSANKTSHAKLAVLRARAFESRRFSDGDPVWYVRVAKDAYSWLHAIPAEFEHYLEENGRSSVRISALLPDGRSQWITTQERRLRPRSVAWADLIELQRIGIPPAAAMPSDIGDPLLQLPKESRP